ncbi:hypothetical protein KIL84_005748 [Mauremys mutica]|uniref:Uncharacterized protein n=1 Tax=Mauremys mutica TaxID=74926 RepID=A0A9D4B323_9SAUR|nr:hypothetical protein KIL84_005748 [Mauremys mutica]
MPQTRTELPPAPAGPHREGLLTPAGLPPSQGRTHLQGLGASLPAPSPGLPTANPPLPHSAPMGSTAPTSCDRLPQQWVPGGWEGTRAPLASMQGPRLSPLQCMEGHSAASPRLAGTQPARPVWALVKGVDVGWEPHSRDGGGQGEQLGLER